MSGTGGDCPRYQDSMSGSCQGSPAPGHMPDSSSLIIQDASSGNVKVNSSFSDQTTWTVSQLSWHLSVPNFLTCSHPVFSLFSWHDLVLCHDLTLVMTYYSSHVLLLWSSVIVNYYVMVHFSGKACNLLPFVVSLTMSNIYVKFYNCCSIFYKFFWFIYICSIHRLFSFSFPIIFYCSEQKLVNNVTVNLKM
jgi:hypothetical protein